MKKWKRISRENGEHVDTITEKEALKKAIGFFDDEKQAKACIEFGVFRTVSYVYELERS